MDIIANFTLNDWLLCIAGAFCVGMGKGGLPGAGNLAIICMAATFDGKTSVGILLPMLICADLVAVKIYHPHTRWNFLLKLLPWSLAGIVLGAMLFNQVSTVVLTRTIGGLLIAMVILRLLNNSIKASLKTTEQTPRFWLFSSTGVIGGMATIMANAAGPVVSIYLAISGLPKKEYIGTAAWFFLIINVIKMPVQVVLGTINFETLQVSLLFGLIAAGCVLIAKNIVQLISQKLFERLIWVFIVVAGLKMLLK